MILTDGIHLVSDRSLAELHEFAERLGLGQHRFRGVRRGHPHYDTKAQLRGYALIDGAREVDTRELLRRMVRK